MLTPVDFANFSQAAGLPYPSTSEEQARLAPAVAQWKQQRDEERRNDVLATIGLGALGAGALGAAGYAGYQFLGRDKRSAQQEAVQAAAEAIAPPAPVDPRVKQRQDVDDAIETVIDYLDPSRSNKTAPYAGTVVERSPERRDAQGNINFRRYWVGDRLITEEFDDTGNIPSAIRQVIPAEFYDEAAKKKVQYGARPGLPVSDSRGRGALIAAPMNRKNPRFNINSEQNDLISFLVNGDMEGLRAKLGRLPPYIGAQLVADLVSQAAVNPASIKSEKVAPIMQLARQLSKGRYTPVADNAIRSARAMVRENYSDPVSGDLLNARALPSSSRRTEQLGYEQATKIYYPNEVDINDYLSEAVRRRDSDGNPIVASTPRLDGSVPGLGRIDDQETIRLAIALDNIGDVQKYNLGTLTDEDITLRYGRMGGRDFFERVVLPRVQIDNSGVTAFAFDGEQMVPIGKVVEGKDELGRFSRTISQPEGEAFAFVPRVDLTDVLELSKGDMYRDLGNGVEVRPNDFILTGGNYYAPEISLAVNSLDGTGKLFRLTQRQPNTDFTEVLTPDEARQRSSTPMYVGYEPAFVDDLDRLVTVGPAVLDTYARQYKDALAAGDENLALQKRQTLAELANAYAQGDLLSNLNSVGMVRRIGNVAQTFPLSYVQPYVAEGINAAIDAYVAGGPGLSMEGLVKESTRRLALPKALFEASDRATVPYSLVAPEVLNEAAKDPKLQQQVLDNINNFYQTNFDLQAAEIVESLDRGAARELDTPWGRNYQAFRNYLMGDGQDYLYSRFNNPQLNTVYADPVVGPILKVRGVPLDRRRQQIQQLQASGELSNEIANAALSSLDSRERIIPFVAVNPKETVTTRQALDFANSINATFERIRKETEEQAKAEVGYYFEDEGGESIVRREAIAPQMSPLEAAIAAEAESSKGMPVDPRERRGIQYIRLNNDRGNLVTALSNYMRSQFQRSPNPGPWDGFEMEAPDGPAVVRDYRQPAAAAVQEELDSRRMTGRFPVEQVLNDEALARRAQDRQRMSAIEEISASVGQPQFSREAVRSAVEDAIRGQLQVQMREPIQREIVRRGRIR
ncbi:hypothetical protein VZG28_04990 [Synechococcus elongatus IITB4]|uniref:hypothetical protein n=1 Tax=Synechococcus elongatus TaxID=32046 RepID=UPI0030CE49D5